MVALPSWLAQLGKNDKAKESLGNSSSEVGHMTLSSGKILRGWYVNLPSAACQSLI